MQLDPKDFDEWYSHYPRKVGKGDAQRAYYQHIKRGHNPRDLLAGVKGYVKQVLDGKVEKRFIPYPASWLRALRWMDEGIAPVNQAQMAELPPSWQSHADKVIKEIGADQFQACFHATQFQEPATIITQSQFLARHIDKKFGFALQRAFGQQVEIRKSP